MFRIAFYHLTAPFVYPAFDLDADGVPELISGWTNGKVEVRKDSDGSLVYSDKFKAPIAHIVKAGLFERINFHAVIHVGIPCWLNISFSPLSQTIAWMAKKS
jgi:hypothetical protein